METTKSWSIGVQDLHRPFDCHPMVSIYWQFLLNFLYLHTIRSYIRINCWQLHLTLNYRTWLTFIILHLRQSITPLNVDVLQSILCSCHSVLLSFIIQLYCYFPLLCPAEVISRYYSVVLQKLNSCSAEVELMFCGLQPSLALLKPNPLMTIDIFRRTMSFIWLWDDIVLGITVIWLIKVREMLALNL